MALRKMSRMLVDPQMLRAATRAMDETLTPKTKKAAARMFLTRATRLGLTQAARPEGGTPELFQQEPPPNLGLLGRPGPQ